MGFRGSLSKRQEPRKPVTGVANTDREAIVSA